jgi:hypothetical protein
MKYIKLFENFDYEVINEDILELKQMSKQMYSFFKKKGFEPELQEKVTGEYLKQLADKGLVSGIGAGVGPAKSGAYNTKDMTINMKNGVKDATITKLGGKTFNDNVLIHVDDIQENVMIAVPASAVADILKKDGKDIKSWVNSPQVIDYVDSIGEDLLGMLKEKYPKMVYQFDVQYGYWFIMKYGYETTRKGGYKK